MNKSVYTTPAGTRDRLFEECVVRRQLEERLAALFRRRGFCEAMTPGLEFYDTVVGPMEAVPPESLYKLCDTRGRLLVLRPDSTMPIARLAATRLQHATWPVRLYYAQDVYHMNHGLYGRRDQEFQMGVELLGAGGQRADLEILALAAQALKLCCGEGFRLELGHADVFRSLMEELDAPEEARSEIRELIENKNYAALGNRLDMLPRSPAAEAIRRLPRLFGGEEVLAAAASLCGNGRATAALTYLSELYRALCALGLRDQVMIDLGMVHRQEYYTGVTFRGYVEGSGETVVSGGRYDRLLEQFGPPHDATGFGLSVDSVAQVLLAKGAVPPPAPPDVLLHAMPGQETAAIREAERLTGTGVNCEVSVFDTLEAARAYAQSRGIPEVRPVEGETV